MASFVMLNQRRLLRWEVIVAGQDVTGINRSVYLKAQRHISKHSDRRANIRAGCCCEWKTERQLALWVAQPLGQLTLSN
jgi:hypothetical protein